jgi:hypothetical protein
MEGRNIGHEREMELGQIIVIAVNRQRLYSIKLWRSHNLR